MAGLDLVVGIATAGRREILTQTLKVIAEQSRLPDRLVLCPAQTDDVDMGALRVLNYQAQVVLGGRGLTKQRNFILENCRDADIIVFLDDDFLPAADFLEQTERLFLERPEIVLATGRVLADGARHIGLSPQEGREILARPLPPEDDPDEIREVYCGYGCNMAIRMEPVNARNLRFDERLPLYGWQEDADFSRQLAPFGRLVKYGRLRGVHLGTKGGRASGVKFGYSQVANPIYLVRKGTFGRRRAVKFIGRNVLRNMVGSLWSEPWVDRRGRFKGNVLAFRDLIAGSLDPGRILNLG